MKYDSESLEVWKFGSLGNQFAESKIITTKMLNWE
jgi:hypothetical protein